MANHRRRWELLRGYEQPKCCARTAVWHRIHSRTFKLGENVEVISSGMSFGPGVVSGNSGENAACGDIRNRFLIQVTYDNGSTYHCLPCEVRRTSHRDSRTAVTQQQQEQQQQGISVTAVAMNGEQHTISALTEDTLVVDLRQKVAKHLGQSCWWLVKLSQYGSPNEANWLEDVQTLGEAGVVNDSSVAFLVKQKDKAAWKWSMACLLQALRNDDLEQVQQLLQEVVVANRKFHLTHLLKNICLAGDMEFLDALAERVPAEVLCQALLIKRNSVMDRYKYRPACIFYTLWVFHFESFKTICVRLFEAGYLAKLQAMLGDEMRTRMFRNVWGADIPESLPWMMPLQMQSRQDLMQSLENPAHQPHERKELNQDFLADVQNAGISFRDLAAMNSPKGPSEFLHAADCRDLPDALKLLFLKWIRNIKGEVCSRPWNWEEFASLSQQGRYHNSFLDAFIAREGLVSMAAAIPEGSVLFDRLAREKARFEDIFIKQISVGKLSHGEGRKACVISALVYPTVNIKVWSLDDGSCLRNISIDSSNPRTVAFSNDSSSILVVSDGTAKIWCLADSSCQCTFAHEGAKIAVFSDNNTMLLTASDNGSVKVWSVEDGECKQTFAHGNLTLVVLSLDNTEALTASEDGTAKLWKLEDGSCMQTFTGHEGEVGSAVLSVNKTTVLTASEDDGFAKLWHLEEGSWSCSHTLAHDDVHLVVLSPDSSLAVTGSSCCTDVRLWRIKDGICQQSLSHPGVSTARFLVDGAILLTSGGGGTIGIGQSVRLWNVAAGACIRTFDCGHPGDNGAWGAGCVAAFFETESLVLTGLERGIVKLWCAQDGLCKHTFNHFEQKDPQDEDTCMAVLRAVVLRDK